MYLVTSHDSLQSRLKQLEMMNKRTSISRKIGKGRMQEASLISLGTISVSKSKIRFDELEKVEHPQDEIKTGASLIPDLNVLVEKMAKKEDDSFIYMAYMLSKKSEYFTPYSLV